VTIREMCRPVLLLLGSVACLAASDAAVAQADGAASAERGAYLATAAGCGMCHTDTAHHGAWLAGGRAIVTPFGTFYTPNISPDPRYGIGTWSDRDFLRALRSGVAPDGSNYYPVFPYTSFAGMSDRDILDIRAYLLAQPAMPVMNRPHDLKFPYYIRWLMTPWKILYFRQGVLTIDPSHSEEWNRGAYLVRAVAHCTECHTPRNEVGALIKKRRYGGVPATPGERAVPDITSDAAALGSWRIDDIASLLKDGITPNGDVVRGPMAEIVNGTAALSDADRHAIAVYIKSLPPVPPVQGTP